jgi:hypothetical protein
MTATETLEVPDMRNGHGLHEASTSEFEMPPTAERGLRPETRSGRRTDSVAAVPARRSMPDLGPGNP